MTVSTFVNVCKSLQTHSKKQSIRFLQWNGRISKTIMAHAMGTIGLLDRALNVTKWLIWALNDSGMKLFFTTM